MTMVGLLIVFVLHNLLLLFLWSHSKRSVDLISKRNYRKLLYIYFLLSLLGMQSGDYLHHAELIEEVYLDMNNSSDIQETMVYYHMEPIYNYLAFLFEGNYILWRSVVFGLSFVIIFWFIKRLALDYWTFFFFFTLICFSGFIIGRLYWGVALFFCSIAYVRKTQNYWFLFFSFLSIFGHKCLYVFPVFLPFAFMKLNRKSLVLMGCLFSVMIIALKYVFADLTIFASFSEGFTRSVISYSEMDSDTADAIFGQSLGERLIYVTEFLSTTILSVYTILHIIRRKVVLPDYIHAMLMLSLAFLLFALSFAICGFESGTFAWRYITISWFPLVFVICFFVENGIMNKTIRNISTTLLFFSFEMALLLPLFYEYVSA